MSFETSEILNNGDIRRKTKRILVTGGCGFIGSHLIDRLLREGNDVICIDNCYSGDKRNILDYLKNPFFEFIRQDIETPFTAEVDQIYHLACPASPVFYQKNPLKTIKTSILGTLNVLEIAKRTGATLLLGSTSEVYGDPTVHPQTETYWGNVNPIGVRSCYDEGKRAAESICFDYYRQYKTDIRVARIFNTYGPRMLENDGRVVSNFITQALRCEPMTVYGDGKQTRSFCYVDETVDGLIRLMNCDVFCSPVNIGNPVECSVLELAKKIKKMTKSNENIVFKKIPSDDPKRRNPDISKAKEFLDWSPTISLHDGLLKTIDYFKKIIKLSK